MRHLKIYLIALLLEITFLFNIERLDLGGENLLNIQTFVYILAIFIAVITLVTSIFSRNRVNVAIVFALALYLIGKFAFIENLPAFTSLSIYVIISEMAFILVIAFTGQRLGRTLYYFQEGLEMFALNVDEKTLRPVNKAGADIRREITRSRHYHRPLSVIVVEPDQHTIDLTLPDMFEELQRSLISRFARAHLAKAMKKHLRLMDLILEDDEQRFIVICPEVDADGSAIVTERIESILKKLKVSTKCSTATFPEEALTFEGLVAKAKAKLPA